MQRPWETHWKDYYAILQVHPMAEPEVIKAAYKRLSLKYHPDKNLNSPQSEERMKDLNEAYEILGDPSSRAAYQEAWERKNISYSTSSQAKRSSTTVPKPKLVVNPPSIVFRELKAGEVKKASFVVQNVGGPSQSPLKVKNPNRWIRVKIVRSSPLNPNQPNDLPCRFEIEAQGEEWEQTYTEYIIIELDQEETRLTITLQMKARPPQPVVNPSVIDFRNVKPGEVWRAFFKVQNQGSPYSVFRCKNPQEKKPNAWLKIVKYHQPDPNQPNEVWVIIECKGTRWGETLLEKLTVSLDQEKAYVEINLKMMPEPARERARRLAQKKARKKRQAKIQLCVAILYGFAYFTLSFFTGKLLALVLILEDILEPISAILMVLIPFTGLGIWLGLLPLITPRRIREISNESARLPTAIGYGVPGIFLFFLLVLLAQGKKISLLGPMTIITFVFWLTGIIVILFLRSEIRQLYGTLISHHQSL